jgi:LEM3-like protein/NUMOD3 motif-containing protein
MLDGYGIIRTNKRSAGACCKHPRRVNPFREDRMSTIPHLYYVYILARPNGVPFYVGKGKGSRLFDHDAEARSGHKCHKCNVIRKIWKQGKEIQRYTVFTTMNEQEALAYECELIASYGRENLTNLTDGGEGVSGMKHTEETRRKIAEAGRGRPSPKSAEQRRKLSAALKGRPLAPHVHEAFVKVNIGREYSKEHCTNISLGQTGGRLYIFVAPDGIQYESVANLEQFAREHSMHSGSLARCATGARKQYRGWIGWIEGEEPRDLPRRAAYTIVAPDGTLYQHISNPNAFAKEHGLDGHGLRAVLRGDRTHYKHWTGFGESS